MKDERIDKCPCGGDIDNDCAGCAYSGNYHYDPKSGACVARPEDTNA